MVQEKRIQKLLKTKTLQRVAKLGAQTVARALTQQLKTKVKITLSHASLISVSEAPLVLGAAQKAVVVHSVLGDASGVCLMFIDKKDASIMSNIMNEKPVKRTTALTKLDKSTIRELSNLLSGAYLNAIVNMTGINLVPSVPRLTPPTEIKKVIGYLQKKATLSVPLIVFETELMIAKYNVTVILVLFFEEGLLKILAKDK